jgi:hypothetical protein
MPADGSPDDLAVGFLAISRTPEKGFAGGHLVLNSRGRPLEFRCTAPVQPNRAQEVLYGPTLGAYVCGELIADALIKSTKSKPSIIFTDLADNMSARSGLTIPLVLVQDRDAAEAEEELSNEHFVVQTTKQKRWRLDAGCDTKTKVIQPKWLQYQLGGRDVAVNPDHAADKQQSLELWQQAEAWIDLVEPFERVHEAIRESLAG